jgi:hypothetical protein
MTSIFDPLAASHRISEDYVRYLRTTFSPDDPVLRADFDRELGDGSRLSRGPILQASAPYKAGASISDLIEDRVLSDELRQLGSAGLGIDRPLYVHQEKAIRKLASGRNVIVATGTGSGKTEAFLLPILDSLLRERESGTLQQSGVRALLLYPMNALANDQLGRLRELLQAFPDVTFGRYVGDTSHTQGQGRSAHRRRFGVDPLPNELVSREVMQARPPHILLTNFAMLEYLLLRPFEAAFFDGPTGEHWRFLVLDEIHVYDGAKGAEMAMLLRRVRDRVNGSESGQLRCIGTSATLGKGREDAPRLIQFGERIFGEPFEWVEDDLLRQDIVEAEREDLVHGPATWFFPEDQLTALRDAFRSGQSTAQIAGFLGEIAGMPKPKPAETPALWLGRSFASETHVVALQTALRKGSLEIENVAADVMSGEDRPALLAALVDICVGSHLEGTNRPLLPARWHFLLRALEGAFACFAESHPPLEPRLLLSRHEECPSCKNLGQRSAMFEVGVCRRCGVPHLVGKITLNEAGLPSFTALPMTDQLPVNLVFVSTLDAAGSDADEDESVADADAAASAHARWRLCLGCGAIERDSNPLCGCGTEVAEVVDVRPNNIDQPLRTCVVCTARTSGAGIVRRFLTGADAPVAVVATSLYQSLPPAPPATSEDEWSTHQSVGEGRKLLSFADSRQDAAFFAPYLERTYNRALQRRLLWEALQRRSDLGSVRPTELYVPLTNAAKENSVVDAGERSVADQARDWIHAELLSSDRQQGLQGVGLVEIGIAPPPGISVPGPLSSKLGLEGEEALDLVRILLGTLITRRALTRDDLVDYEDPIFGGYPLTSVRLTGSANRIISWIPSGKGATNQRVTYLQRVLDACGSNASPVELLETMWTRWLTGPDSPWSSVLIPFNDPKAGILHRLDSNRIEFSALSPDHQPMRCNRCRQTWWRAVRGICPGVRCDGVVRPIPASDDQNHYRRLYTSMSHIGVRVEEHTAQLTADVAGQRQQEFIDGRINILSCSTTFELGVDVGEVVAVLMRNVPPSPANYVQRAGRAGRRAGSPALVVTFAQRRSHDLHFFDEPFAMIDGHVAAPILEIENPHIVRRHLNAIAFSAWERLSLSASFPVGHKKVSDFLFPEVGAPSDQMMAWLHSQPEALGDAVERICPPGLRDHDDLKLSGWAWLDGLDGDPSIPGMGRLRVAQARVRQEVADLEQTEEELAAEKNYGPAGAVKRVRETLTRQASLQFLAQKGILPKYGFPVDVVSLRLPEQPNLDLDRDLAMAIVEFAPGAEIVADKRLWKSIGIERPAGLDFIVKRWRECGHCGTLRTWLADTADQLECGVCGSIEVSGAGAFIHPIFGFVGEMMRRPPGDSRPVRQGFRQYFFTDYAGGAPTPVSVALGRGAIDVCYSRQGQITVLNEGRKSAGFNVCRWCGWAASCLEPVPIDSHKVPGSTRRVCRGVPVRLTLGHEYLTDSVELRLGGSFGRDQVRSTLHALLAVVDQVGIENNDVNGVPHASVSGNDAMVIFDSVPGGAGHARRISEVLPELFEAALRKVSLCECGEETSCYGCLRSYRNQTDHERLTRRDAIEVLNALLN